MMYRFISLATVIGALVVACGDSDSGGVLSDTDGGNSGDTQADVREQLREQIFGRGFTYLEDYYPTDFERRSEQSDLKEGVIQKCMRDVGFEYVVVEYEDFYLQRQELERLGVEGFFREYGFGRATLYEPQEAQLEAFAVTYEDPNQAIREQLPPDQQLEYDRALAGDMAEFIAEETRGEDQPPLAPDQVAEPEEMGCTGKAELVANPHHEFPKAMMDEVESVYEAIEADQELRSAESSWSDCMNGRGFDFETIADAYSAVNGEIDSILYRTTDMKEVEAEGHGGQVVTVEIPAVAPEPWERAMQNDREIGWATYDCAVGVDFWDTQEAVTLRHQLEFIEAWEDEVTIHSAEDLRQPGFRR